MTPDPSLSPDTLLDAAVSARNEATDLRHHAKAAWKRATQDAEEIASYRNALMAIEARAKKEYDAHLEGVDILIVLVLIEVSARRALAYTGPRRRTWRDRVAEVVARWRAGR